MKNIKLTFLLLILTAVSCTSDDSTQTERNNFENLTFNQIFEFDSNFLEGISMGMANSISENSLYISSRDDYPLVVGSNREQIIKLNLDSGNITEKIYSNSDFITKRLLVSNNQLISIGGQFSNIYDLDIINDPITESHGKILSHFKIVEDNDDTYIIGGDFINQNDSNKIYKWNFGNPQDFIEFSTIPETRYGASGAIINENLYIFGGSSDESLSLPSDKIYIIPLNNPQSIQELNLGISFNETFTQKYNDLIIIAGLQYTYDNQGNIIGKNSILGKFDLNTGVFQEMEHNLKTLNPDYYIGQMSIINNKLYVVYGFVESNTPSGTSLSSEWSVYSAELN
jgi:hypothetical protein